METVTITKSHHILIIQMPHLVIGQSSQAQMTHLSLLKAPVTHSAPLIIPTTLTQFLQSSTPLTLIMITSHVTQSRVAGFQEVRPTRDSWKRMSKDPF